LGKRPKQKSAKQQFRLTCMFCDSSGSSREHYFSTWMHPYFDHLPKRVSPALHTSKYEIASGESKTILDQRESGRSRVHDPVRQVCEDCNNQWMSEIVKRSQSAIERWCLPSSQDRIGPISVVDQEAMAKWSVLTAITYVTAKRKESRVTTFDRAYLKTNSEPPPYWKVAMARTVSPDCHAILADHAILGASLKHEFACMIGGPWVAITLIDAMFFVWREARGSVPFLRALTIPPPVLIHPARSTPLSWGQLPLYEQDLASMSLEQLALVGEANRLVLTPKQKAPPGN
jgi:hypothetical protein